MDLTAALAIAASKLSLDHSLLMADGIILTTAKEFKATIWTAVVIRMPGGVGGGAS